jgi:hypothetical protein
MTPDGRDTRRRGQTALGDRFVNHHQALAPRAAARRQDVSSRPDRTRVIALPGDFPLWSRIRQSTLERVTAELGPDAFASRVARLSGGGTIGRVVSRD